jgi:hypothetical protein
MITAPNRRDPLVGNNGAPTSRFAEYLERNADDVNANTDNVNTLQTDVDTLNAIGEEFSASNVTTTKSFDADTVTLTELADVVGSIIERLQE